MTEKIERFEVTTGLIGRSYEHRWKICNWDFIRKNTELMSQQNFEIETGKYSGIQSKWSVTLRYDAAMKRYFIDLKLLSLKNGVDKVHTSFLAQLLYADETSTSSNFKFDVILKENQRASVSIYPKQENWDSCINSDGSLTIRTKLTLLQTISLADDPDIPMKMEKYRTSLMEGMCKNQATLLNDESTADLKIVTSDGKELFAHQLILQAQCPVFSTMYRSDMSEARTGILNLDDISGKTMEVILHYFYTGIMLSSCLDTDTIVEFTYAAGKYQMTAVLQMLDSVLGTTDQEEVSSFDLELLSLAHKLSLKNAESRLMKRVAKLPTKVTSAAEMLTLFGNVSINDNDSQKGHFVIKEITK